MPLILLSHPGRRHVIRALATAVRESYATCGRGSKIIAVDEVIPGCQPSLEILRGIQKAVRRRVRQQDGCVTWRPCGQPGG